MLQNDNLDCKIAFDTVENGTSNFLVTNPRSPLGQLNITVNCPKPVKKVITHSSKNMAAIFVAIMPNVIEIPIRVMEYRMRDTRSGDGQLLYAFTMWTV